MLKAGAMARNDDVNGGLRRQPALWRLLGQGRVLLPAPSIKKKKMKIHFEIFDSKKNVAGCVDNGLNETIFRFIHSLQNKICCQNDNILFEQ